MHFKSNSFVFVRAKRRKAFKFKLRILITTEACSIAPCSSAKKRLFITFVSYLNIKINFLHYSLFLVYCATVFVCFLVYFVNYVHYYYLVYIFNFVFLS